MPPLQQRPLPSAWDRGGLLGPRGNARFLEVDGLRVKYTGRLWVEEKESVVIVGGIIPFATLAVSTGSVHAAACFCVALERSSATV